MAQEVSEVLGRLDGWASGDGPLYQQLSASLRGAIERGEVTPGSRLPPERLLAAKLNVSRTTVVAAYEALREEGLVERRQGSGTRIAVSAAPRASGVREAELVAALHRNVLFRGVIEGTDDCIDLLAAHPPATRHFSPELLTAADAELTVVLRHHGYFPAGYPPLRKAIADYFTGRGVPTTEGQVLVTGGAQQAFSLATAFFLQRGDPLALENPTYPGAMDAATAVGAQLLPIPVGIDGARLNTLAGILANRSAKLVYLNPTFHNPTGTVMPKAARAEVARLVSRHEVVLIEDEVVTELALGGEAPPPIAAYAPDGPILTVGSMSKVFWAGLRVGWIRAPEPLIRRLTRFKAVLDLGGSLPGQIQARLLLGLMDTVRRERQGEIATRMRLLQDLLARHAPTWSWTPPKGGLVLWVRLPFGSARQLAVDAQRRGVAILPGAVTSSDLSFDDHIRLTVAQPPELLTEGIHRLTEAWSDYAARPEGSGGQLEVVV